MFIIYVANIQKLFAGCTQWLTWDFLLVCHADPWDPRKDPDADPAELLEATCCWVAAPNGGSRNSNDLKIHLFLTLAVQTKKWAVWVDEFQNWRSLSSWSTLNSEVPSAVPRIAKRPQKAANEIVTRKESASSILAARDERGLGLWNMLFLI